MTVLPNIIYKWSITTTMIYFPISFAMITYVPGRLKENWSNFSLLRFGFNFSETEFLSHSLRNWQNFCMFPLLFSRYCVLRGIHPMGKVVFLFSRILFLKVATTVGEMETKGLVHVQEEL